jgi:hypothetical protein
MPAPAKKPSKQVIIAGLTTIGAIIVAAIGIIPQLLSKADKNTTTPPRPSTEAKNNSIAVSGVSAGRDANVTVNADREKSPGRAVVTDTIVDDYRPSFDALVDFRVTNKGELPVSISRVRFKVLSVEEIPTKGGLPFSANYDLDISSLWQVGQTAEVAVAHQLTASETDRFSVTLTARKMGMGVFRVWLLQPTLITSNGDVEGTPIRLGLPWNIQKSMRIPMREEKESEK